jgi:primase-polymerase (primpol)-like protein
VTAAPAKPALLRLNPANIPPELRAIPAWVGWRLVFEYRRWMKKPIQIRTGNLAETDDPSTWCDFETTLQGYERLGCDGIGLCRTADFVFIDCDGVFDRDGHLLPFTWAEQILSAISGRAYLEKSITGTGLHGIGRGTLPPGRRQFDDPGRTHTGYAFYDNNRFFTFSGAVLPSSGELCDLTPELASLHRELFPVAATNGTSKIGARPTVRSLSDGEVLERACRAKDGAKFSRLLRGDFSDYPSHSEADLAFCCKLAFWTQRDAGRIDTFFRQSGLMRDKWLRDDYREQTIAKACQATTEIWEPRSRNSTPMTAEAQKDLPSDSFCPTGGLRDHNAEESHTDDQPEVDAARPSSRHGELPRICSNGRQLRDISNDALRALQSANDPPELFARTGMMVAIIRDEKRRQVIADVGVDALCGRLARSADYFKVSTTGDEYDCAPPPGVVKDIHALAPGEWKFPPLDALTEIPILRPDGSILDRHGYDPATRLYYTPDPNLRIPALVNEPSSGDIQIALGTINNSIGEFPYADDASYANTIAAMLTPIIRPAINAPAPLGLLDAPQASTGKSLLCDMIAIIATGRAGEMFSPPKDEDEWRKVITTALMTGTSVVIFDNVTRPLESGDLCSALTATTWSDRAMRTHSKITLPVKATFLASGNNIRLAGDMPRRCYRVRLDAQSSEPFLRAGPEPGKKFKIPDLKEWTTEHRGELLSALLTLARAWYVAGKPKPKIKPIGSFEKWTTTVGGILEFAGVKGFMENAPAMYEDADDESREWEEFLLVLHEIFYGEAFTVAEIVEKLNSKTSAAETYSSEPTAHATELKAVLPGFLAEALGRDGFFQKRLGKAFAAKGDRRFGSSGVYLKRGKLQTGRLQWEIIIPGVTGPASA